MADFPLTYTDVSGASVTISPSTVDVDLNQTTVRTTSLSGRQQVRSFGTSSYIVTLNFPPLDEEDRAQIKAKLTSLRGGVNTFTIATDNFTSKKGTSTAEEELGSSFTGAVGVTQVTTIGSNEFKPGEYFKFSNHNKVYQVITCSGTTLTFEPFLQTAVAQGSGHDIRSGANFIMTCRLADDNISYSQGADGFSRVSFTAIEVI